MDNLLILFGVVKIDLLEKNIVKTSKKIII